MSLRPYDAICFVSYGGPNAPEDVLPFMRNATRGRGIPDERLIEVSSHYQMFDGRSPINERNAELMSAVGHALAQRGIELPIVIGNRNWHPFFTETLGELKKGGAKRVLCVITSAYASYSGCRQYREDLARALDEIGGGLELDKIGPFASTSGFIEANVSSVRKALAEQPDSHVLFVTHSIPMVMEQASGPEAGELSPEQRDTYVAQHRRVISQVMARVGPGIDHELVFCSRSGSPHVPWLEPDVNDRITELAESGVTRIITVPIGFVNDHMEVVYDLDTQACKTAEEHNVSYLRAPTPGTHPALIASIVETMVARAAVARGEQDEPADARFTCPVECCLPCPGMTPQPAIN